VTNETVITVQGEYTARYAPERALATISIGFEGPDRGPVFELTTDVADGVRARIVELHDPGAGPVTWWASDSVRVWSSKPWNNEGKQLPPVHHSTIEFRVRFNDFPALARWIEEIALVDGATVGGIEWDLTDPRRTVVTAEVRSRAVKDAVSKATVFAQSIGLGTVRAIALADPGMLGDQGTASPGNYDELNAVVVGHSSGGELSLKPADIEVSAAVDARFLAS
jgi:hypothetical protein